MDDATAACGTCQSIIDSVGGARALFDVCLAEHDAAACAEACIRAGANVDDRGQMENPPIVCAAARENGVLQVLLDHGADIENCGDDNNRPSALWEACKHRQYQNVMLLLSRGADVNHEAWYDEVHATVTPLEVITIDEVQLSEWGESGDLMCAYALLRHPGVRLATAIPGRLTPLRIACNEGIWSLAKVILYTTLERFGARTAISHLRPLRGVTCPVEILCVAHCIKHRRARFTFRDVYDEAASEKYDTEEERIGRALCHACAQCPTVVTGTGDGDSDGDGDGDSDDGVVVSMLLCLPGGLSSSSLSAALLYASTPYDVHALIDAGADPNFVDDRGCTRLFHERLSHGVLRSYGTSDVTRALLARGADVDFRNREGTTALQMALEALGDSGDFWYAERMEALLRHGARLPCAAVAMQSKVGRQFISPGRVADRASWMLVVLFYEAFAAHAVAQVLFAAAAAAAGRRGNRGRADCEQCVGEIVTRVASRFIALPSLRRNECVRLACVRSHDDDDRGARAVYRRRKDESVECWARRRRREVVCALFDTEIPDVCVNCRLVTLQEGVAKGVQYARRHCSPRDVEAFIAAADHVTDCAPVPAEVALAGACYECRRLAKQRGIDSAFSFTCRAPHDAAACAKALILAGANIDGKVLEVWEERDPPVVVSAAVNNGVLRVLLDHNVDLTNREWTYGYTAVETAALKGRHENLALLLAARGVDINSGTTHRSTLELITADGRHASLRCVRLLLARPDIALATRGRVTALRNCVDSNDWPVASAILNHTLEHYGARVAISHLRPLSGARSAVEILCVMACVEHASSDFTFLDVYTDEEDSTYTYVYDEPRASADILDTVEDMVGSALLNVCEDDRGGHWDDSDDNDDNTDRVICRIVIDAMVQLCGKLNMSSRFLSKALLRARSAWCIHLLVDAGANPNFVDHKGRRALTCALRTWHSPRLLHALVERGADVDCGDASSGAGSPLHATLTRVSDVYFPTHCKALLRPAVLLRHGARVPSIASTHGRVYQVLSDTDLHEELKLVWTLVAFVSEAFAAHAVARVLLAGNTTVGHVHTVTAIVAHVARNYLFKLNDATRNKCVQLAALNHGGGMGGWGGIDGNLKRWSRRRRRRGVLVNAFLGGEAHEKGACYLMELCGGATCAECRSSE